MNHAKALANYRAKHPASRIVSVVKYVHNTSCSKRRGCVLCGEEGPGWCARYPRTQQSTDWEVAHLASHFGDE